MDSTTYDKAAKHPPRWGYQARGNAAPSSIIIHTTSNRRATQFETEAKYLLDSSSVSAHFLIGKDGRTVQFLDPLKWQAWHAGNCLPPYLNPRSIGVEHHVSVGETWTKEQHEACTQLVQRLMRAYGIPPARIETHRAVALPVGRKSDPAGWDDPAFYAWRATLVSPPQPPVKKYRVRGAAVYHAESGIGTVAGYLAPGDEVLIDKTYASGTGHIADSTPKYGGLGFIRLSEIEAI